MTNSMMQAGNCGAPGPFQSGFSMLPNHLRPSDQGFVMGGNIQSMHSERPSGGDSSVSNVALLTHAEREARIKEILGQNCDRYKAMTGKVQKISCDETPKDDDGMGENESSMQVDLFAALSNRCPMWLLHHIKSADVFPLCSPERQEHTRQFIALAGSIFNVRTDHGEVIQTPDMRVYETVVEGKGQCFILSRGELANDDTMAPIVRRLFLNDVLENRETKNIGLCTAERTMKVEYESLDLKSRASIEAFTRKYTQGVFNSGFAEMLYFAQEDQCDYLVCSVLQDVTPTGDRANHGLLVPVAYVPCLDGSTTQKPLKLLKAGVVSEEQASFRWIMFEHGALANPAALEQITHFNVLRELTAGQRPQGIRHIIVTAIPQTYASNELAMTSEIAGASEEFHSMCDEQGEEMPDVDVIEQIAQDRLALTQSNLLRRVIRIWRLTTKDLTKATHFRLEHRIVQIARLLSKCFDALKLECTVSKKNTIGQQMLNRIVKDSIKSKLFHRWIGAVFKSLRSTPDTKDNMVSTIQPGVKHARMSNRQRKLACQTMRHRTTRRINKERLLLSYNAWINFMAIKACFITVMKRTKHNRYVVAWKEWQFFNSLIKLRKKTQAQYENELLASTYAEWYQQSVKVVPQRQELSTELSTEPNDIGTDSSEDNIDVIIGKAFWNMACFLDRKRWWRHTYLIFRTWWQLTQLVTFTINSYLRKPRKCLKLWKMMSQDKLWAQVRDKKFLSQVIATWSKYTATQEQVRVMATWKPLMATFSKWRKRYHLKQKEMEISYRPVKLWLDKWTMAKKFFTMWYEYYDLLYDIPRERLEYHFKKRNYRRSVKRVFEEWAYYTSLEDTDSSRPWVIYSYQRLMKTRSKLLSYWFTKTKTYKLQMTADQHVRPTNRVTPAMTFRQSSRYDDLRSKLRQLLVKMRNSRLCASAKAVLAKTCGLRSSVPRPKSDNDSDSAQQSSVPFAQISTKIVVCTVQVIHWLIETLALFTVDLISLMWSILLVLISMGLLINQVLSEFLVSAIIILSMISMTVLSFVLVITIEVSLQVHNFLGITLDKVLDGIVYFCYTCVPYVLEQTGGILRKGRQLRKDSQEGLLQVQSQVSNEGVNQVQHQAMTATIIMKNGEIDFEGFDLKYSLIDTGTDAVLRTDQSNVDPSSVREANASITTAGGHVLRANCSGTLTTYLADAEFNMRLIDIPDALIVPNLVENLTSHRPFVEMGHLVFFHKQMSGSLLDCKCLRDVIKLDRNVIPFDRRENGLEYLVEYIPKSLVAQAMVAMNSPKLPYVEYLHLVCQHMGRTLMKCLKLVASDVGDIHGINSLNCPSCIEGKMKHSPYPGRSETDDQFVVSFDMFGPFKHESVNGNRYGLVFVTHRNHLLFGYPMRKKNQFPDMLRTFLLDVRQIFEKFPKAMEFRIMRSDNAKEFNSAEVKEIFAQFGIIHQFSASNQQYQDGTSEKAVRDMNSMVRTMMLFSKAPKRLWDWELKYACNVERFLQTSANPGFQSPLQMLIDSTVVWVDNTATLAVANGNDFTHETVKHVTVKVRFLQECVQRKILLLAAIRTHQNIADILTKQSVGPQFRLHRNYILGMTDTIDLQVEAKYAHVTVGKARRRQLKRKRILARQECDDLVKF